jgi:hypothetical protein
LCSLHRNWVFVEASSYSYFLALRRGATGYDYQMRDCRILRRKILPVFTSSLSQSEEPHSRCGWCCSRDRANRIYHGVLRRYRDASGGGAHWKLIANWAGNNGKRTSGKGSMSRENAKARSSEANIQ